MLSDAGVLGAQTAQICGVAVKTVRRWRRLYQRRGQPRRASAPHPRYVVTNRSADIRGLCTWALDLRGIPWRPAGHWNVSVARREGVAALDAFVGPKY